MPVAESTLEEALLEWLQALGYSYIYGPDIDPGTPNAERDNFSEVVLQGRLNTAIAKLNPALPIDAIEEAMRKMLRSESPSLILNNKAIYNFLRDGITVEYRREDGSIAAEQCKIIDFENIERNDWLVVNQFSIQGEKMRRPDVLIFVNGLPLAVVELKNPTDEDATIDAAFRQLQTYKQQIPMLFQYNQLLVVSDGLLARVGSLTADTERFMPWRTIDGENLVPDGNLELETVVSGCLDPKRFLQLIEHFVAFDVSEDGTIKKIVAAYHQFHAVNKAVVETVRASAVQGDRRCGVVWHTQGSGKSFTMLFFAGRIIAVPEMENPTVVVLTDRNDLDDQLFGQFARCEQTLRQTPQRIEDRADLRSSLKRASGGVIFTTIQKFMPEEKGDSFPLLSDRRNIVVIADEAHRSQYDFIDGYARNMRDALPNASFIGFTGTPIELTDKNTRAVFGNYISIYDIQQAVEDKATVPIYYESRLAKIDLLETERPRLDEDFEEVTEGEEESNKEKLKTKWSTLEAVVGADKRIDLIAQDLVAHFEARLEGMEGKAMVVCMSRRICVSLFEAIGRLRKDWVDDDETKGSMKVVMTGSASDEVTWQRHIRTKKEREAIAKRFKNPIDPLKLVIVRDMWLTGFDVPCLHTMYVDKPMHSHGLMQTIARVNRVFKDKPGGLIVDYLGLGTELKKALSAYTSSGGKGAATIDQEQAVAVMLEKHELCSALFHGFNHSSWASGRATDQLRLLPAAQQHVLVQNNGKDRLLRHVLELSKAFALSVPHPEAIRIRDDVSFFQAVRAALIKTGIASGKPRGQMDHAIRQLISEAVAPQGVIDVFAAAGLKKPDISILSDEFLEDVRKLQHKNLAVELLQKLLNDEIKTRSKRNVVMARSFSDLLLNAVRRYQNRAIETAQIIEELIALAQEMRQAANRGESLGLTEDEVAFYDALADNETATDVLGDVTLKMIARDLVDHVRRNVSIDWQIKESARAKLRTIVKRILRRYGYPPDKQDQATELVLKQAEVLCEEWVA